MFIAPKTQSTDYYTKRMRRVLDIIIDGRGTKPLVKSLDELTERLADPVRHLGAQLAGRSPRKTATATPTPRAWPRT